MFLLSGKPEGDTVAEEKLRFFWADPEMLALRASIWKNLGLCGEQEAAFGHGRGTDFAVEPLPSNRLSHSYPETAEASDTEGPSGRDRWNRMKKQLC